MNMHKESQILKIYSRIFCEQQESNHQNSGCNHVWETNFVLMVQLGNSKQRVSCKLIRNYENYLKSYNKNGYRKFI